VLIGVHGTVNIANSFPDHDVQRGLIELLCSVEFASCAALSGILDAEAFALIVKTKTLMSPAVGYFVYRMTSY